VRVKRVRVLLAMVCLFFIAPLRALPVPFSQMLEGRTRSYLKCLDVDYSSERSVVCVFVSSVRRSPSIACAFLLSVLVAAVLMSMLTARVHCGATRCLFQFSSS
jgi:hypothetical protein